MGIYCNHCGTRMNSKLEEYHYLQQQTVEMTVLHKVYIGYMKCDNCQSVITTDEQFKANKEKLDYLKTQFPHTPIAM